MTKIVQFLKKHYEKIVLCLILLGLAAAAFWMSSLITGVKAETTPPPAPAAPTAATLAPLDLTPDVQALAEVTNPPPVMLSGDHNLFNPVTWRRRGGEWLKILRTGPDALSISNITPLYTVVTYDHPSGNGAIYIMGLQIHSVKKQPEYAQKDVKTKSGLYIIRSVQGPPDNPTALNLEIPDTGETVVVAPGKPYQRVDGYLVDMKYAPESRSLNHERLNDTITLDNEPYKIVEITNNLVRVQAIKNTKITTINFIKPS